MSKKQPCAYCGGLVEELQHAPFPGHSEGCRLREEWLEHGHYPDGIDALEARCTALTAENAKLRAEVEKLEEVAMRGEATFINTATALRLDLAAREPPATEQRYWRVKEHPGWHAVEQFHDEQGRLHTKSLSTELRSTRAEAEADGRASGLPEYQPAIPTALPTEETVPARGK